jgi:hypothetical protein
MFEGLGCFGESFEPSEAGAASVFLDEDGFLFGF